jgi:hypothetical protein
MVSSRPLISFFPLRFFSFSVCECNGGINACYQSLYVCEVVVLKKNNNKAKKKPGPAREWLAKAGQGRTGLFNAEVVLVVVVGEGEYHRAALRFSSFIFFFSLTCFILYDETIGRSVSVDSAGTLSPRGGNSWALPSMPSAAAALQHFSFDLLLFFDLGFSRPVSFKTSLFSFLGDLFMLQTFYVYLFKRLPILFSCVLSFWMMECCHLCAPTKQKTPKRKKGK